jgi:hypothetical protein
MSLFLLAATAIAGYYLWNRVSGRLGPEWKDLAERFPDRAVRPVATYSLQSAKLGSLRYAGCLRFEVSEYCWRISGLGPFAYAAGPPMVLPLDRISFEPASAGLALTPQARVLIEGIPDLRFSISRGVARRLIRASRLQIRSTL